LLLHKKLNKSFKKNVALRVRNWTWFLGGGEARKTVLSSWKPVAFELWVCFRKIAGCKNNSFLQFTTLKYRMWCHCFYKFISLKIINLLKCVQKAIRKYS
jgi:hypothetical protein